MGLILIVKLYPFPPQSTENGFRFSETIIIRLTLNGFRNKLQRLIIMLVWHQQRLVLRLGPVITTTNCRSRQFYATLHHCLTDKPCGECIELTDTPC